VNSIDLPGDGTFVVSMRNTWAAYKVNIKSGAIEWTLGGRHTTFKLGKDADFQWQHHVALYPGTPYLTVFDDHCCQITGGGTYVSPTAPSRGLVLKLDLHARTATFAGAYGHGNDFDSEYMGSIQPLPGGNELVGWGSQPFLSEYTASGQLLLDAALPNPDISYRATLQPWEGLPPYPPAGRALQKDGKTTVYASWNGATRVASWRVLGGQNTAGLRVVARRPKSGFETAIPLPQSYISFAVQALDARGRAIGVSRTFGVSGPGAAGPGARANP
jgi:hypothetical protein